MIMAWFIPLGVGLGLAGTRTSLQSRHPFQPGHLQGSWWLLAALSWLPIACWLMAQFVFQG